jgi:hypothetical protein
LWPNKVKQIATTREYRKVNRIRAVAEWSTDHRASDVKDLYVGIEVELLLSETFVNPNGPNRSVQILAATIDGRTDTLPRDYCFKVDLVGWTKTRSPFAFPLRSCDADTEVKVPALNIIDWARRVGLVYNGPDDPRIVRTLPVHVPATK